MLPGPSRGLMQASGLTLRRFWTVFFAILLGPVEQVLWKPVSTIRARGLLRPRWRLHVLPGAERHVLHCVATLRRDLRGGSYNTIYIYIYIYIYGTPPMYPRLSSQSRLWEGMGSWDALVPMPFSEISAAERRGLMGSGECL